MKRVALWCGVAWAIGACGTSDSAVELKRVQSSEDAERWSAQDDPTLFGQSLEYRLERLPTHGVAKNNPWVGSYWPIANDSINYPWAGAGQETAPAKYGRAFGVAGVEAAVSRNHGIDNINARTCTSAAQCSGNEKCAMRSGYGVGKCIPGWWGLCHAWAAVSIMFQEPRHAVTINDVTFNVNDIKALLTVAHYRPAARQVALRCESLSLGRDIAGRPVSPSCRDSNPGSFHLLLANYLGYKGQSFIEDRSINSDVWNHPLRGFFVRDMREVSAAEANTKLGVGNWRYPYNRAAETLVYVMTDVGFMLESQPTEDGNLSGATEGYTGVDRYEYILELDGAGRIIGGEWVGESKNDHPDFLWLPTGTLSQTSAGGAIDYNKVMSLYYKSL